jgi:membrane protein
MIKATFRLIGLLSKKIGDDHVAAFSAQAAFFIIISFFPFIMLLLSIVQYFQIGESNMYVLFTQAFPTAVDSMIVTVINEIYDTAASSTLISITAITTLWSAGKGFLAVMRGLNSVYERNQTISFSSNYFCLLYFNICNYADCNDGSVCIWKSFVLLD